MNSQNKEEIIDFSNFNRATSTNANYAYTEKVNVITPKNVKAYPLKLKDLNSMLKNLEKILKHNEILDDILLSGGSITVSIALTLYSMSKSFNLKEIAFILVSILLFSGFFIRKNQKKINVNDCTERVLENLKEMKNELEQEEI